jgi:hypothetical protein
MRIEPPVPNSLVRSLSAELVHRAGTSASRAVHQAAQAARAENDMARARLLADVERHLHSANRKGRNIDIMV